MNKISALFFDLDGTLLNSQKQISRKTAGTLQKCKDKGVKLFIATARPPLLDKMLSWDASVLSLFDGGSYYNGGCVVLDRYKSYTPVSDDVVRASIALVYRYDAVNIALQMECEKHAFRFPLDGPGYRSWGLSADDAFSVNETGDMKTIKILIFYHNFVDTAVPVDGSLVSALGALCENTARLYLTDNGTLVQIMARGVNKANGVKKIQAAYGFTNDEIAVFGDDVNDIEMLTGCRVSVAVANAPNDVKAAANYICGSNDCDGVAEWIEDNVLID